MGRDSRFHSVMVCNRMATSAEPNEHENKVGEPANEQRPHEPVAELNDVIDLKSVLGSIRRLAEKFVDQSEATHNRRNLLRRTLDVAPKVSANAARYAG